MPKKNLIVISVSVLVVLLFAVTAFLITTKSTNKPEEKPAVTTGEEQTGSSTSSKKTSYPPSIFADFNLPDYSQKYPPDKVIAIVGKEKIYQKDFETELNNYPSKTEEDRKKLFDKIVDDSRLLQIAKDNNLPPSDVDEAVPGSPINPPASTNPPSSSISPPTPAVEYPEDVYNSPNKDYPKRVALVEKAKKSIKNGLAKINGSIVSVWFLNDRVGPLGYDKAKQLALDKITVIHEEMKNGRISIKQAGEMIKNDYSLASLDKNYKNNAIFSFSAMEGDSLTWEKAFDQELFSLDEGGLTNIFTASSADFDHNKQVVPAYYMFGQVTKKNLNATKSIDDLKNKYGVVYY